MVESIGSGEISLSTCFLTMWKTGSDQLSIACSNNGDKIGKLIDNYLNRFIDTSLNCMPIRSRLVSQQKKINFEQQTNV